MNILKLLLFLVLLSSSLPVRSDTLAQPAEKQAPLLRSAEPEQTEDDFSLLVLGSALIGFLLILAGFGAGAVLMLALLGLLFGLISAGIFSASLLIGLHKRSFAQGFRVFVLSGSSVCGALTAGIALPILFRILHWPVSAGAIACGALAGLVAGLLIGALFLYALRGLARWFRSRLDSL